MSDMALDLHGLSTALELSLERWVKRSRYKKMWDSVPTPVRLIAGDAFKELRSMEPFSFDMWWVQNHSRYIFRKDIRQIDLNKLHQVMHFFLTDFYRGKVSIEHTNTKKETSAGKKTNKRRK